MRLHCPNPALSVPGSFKAFPLDVSFFFFLSVGTGWFEGLDDGFGGRESAFDLSGGFKMWCKHDVSEEHNDGKSKNKKEYV